MAQTKRPRKGNYAAYDSNRLEKRHRGPILKEYFPQLLKKTLSGLQATSQKNTLSGFKAYGIIPLNTSEVLKRMPDTSPNNIPRERGADWCAVFEEHLKESRAADTTPQRQRRKKLRIEAGKAVGATDLEPQGTEELSDNESNEESEPQSTQKASTNENVRDEETAESLQAETEMEEVHKTNASNPIIISIGIVKKIAAKVDKKNGDDFVVNCLRKTGGNFVFPNVEDTITIAKSQVSSNSPKRSAFI